MKYNIFILNIALTLAALVKSEELEDNVSKRSVEEHGAGVGGGHVISQHVEILKQIPIVHYKGIPVPVPHPIGVPVHVPIHVPEPVPIEVPVPITILKTIPIHVAKPVPLLVEKPYPIEVIEKIPYPIPKPYPVHVPVYRTKHIYHSDSIIDGGYHHGGHHGWA